VRVNNAENVLKIVIYVVNGAHNQKKWLSQSKIYLKTEAAGIKTEL
jgi:hypothetical protein